MSKQLTHADLPPDVLAGMRQAMLDQVSRPMVYDMRPIGSDQMSDGSAGAEMPRYRSHKEVWALKITYVDGDLLAFADAGHAPMRVDPKMFARYTPVPGDYFVVYRDGYESISPGKEFEDGYTHI